MQRHLQTAALAFSGTLLFIVGASRFEAAPAVAVVGEAPGSLHAEASLHAAVHGAPPRAAHDTALPEELVEPTALGLDAPFGDFDVADLAPHAGPGAMDPLLLPDAEDLSLAWVPPTWFPEAAHEPLLALDAVGLPGEPDVGPGLGLRARSVFVVDLDSGAILLSRNADDRRPVASLTKLVAALAVASEAPDLDRPLCTDTGDRPSWPGATSKIRTGTCTTGWDLVGAALVKSDNGAATALPRVAGLPFHPFVSRMNTVAADLGMSWSTFSDPSGAEDDNLSTARDMTRAAIAASLHPLVAPAASAEFWDFQDISRGTTRRFFTTNRLVGRAHTEVLAAKTGYTDTARYCFTGVFRLDGGRRVAVTVLGSPRERHRWSDLRRILDWVERGV